MDDELLRLTPLLRARPFFLVLADFRRRLAISFLRHATRLEFRTRFFALQNLYLVFQATDFLVLALYRFRQRFDDTQQRIH